MKNHPIKTTGQRTFRRIRLFGLSALAAVVFAPSPGRADNGSQNEFGLYRQTNLVSDLPGVAQLQDTNLINAWGISFSSTSPFWVSANGSGRSVLYSVTNDSSGNPSVTKVGLEVTIPGEGNVTGQVFNNHGGFNGDVFLFVSEDGTISGWKSSLGTAAETLTNRPTAVYKGVTLVTNGSGPLLLAANFAEATIDVYDGGLNLLGQFSDPRAPAGYAPFNVQSIHGHIFVTFARQDAAHHDDMPGPGHGLIDVFNVQTGRFHRFATGSDAGGTLRVIDSPWGVALAPRNFGSHGDQLLVGNFGSGKITAFDADGTFAGLLRGVDRQPIVIDGLWALTVGNGGKAGVSGRLYFSAGPGGESDGLFGSLQPALSLHRDRGDEDPGED